MKFITLALSLAMLLGATTAQAQTVTIKAEAGDEQVLVTIPDGWKRVHSDKATEGDVRTAIYEYLPPGKVVTDWDEMITVVVMTFADEVKDGIERNTAVAMTKSFYKDLCDSHPDQMSIFPNTVNGFGTAAFSAGCEIRKDAKTQATERGYLRNVEFLSGVVVRGTRTLFQVQHAWHSDLIKSDAKGNLTGPDEAMTAMAQAAEDATALSFEGVWPCDPSRKDRACAKPH